MKKIRSISLRLSLNILLVVSLLLIAMLSVAAISSYYMIAEEAEKAAVSKLHEVIKDIEAPLHEVEIATRDAAQIAEATMQYPGMLDKIAAGLAERNKSIAACRVQHTDCSTPTWSNPHLDPKLGKVVSYCYPLSSGALFVDVQTDWIEQILKSTRPYADSYASIFCPDGQVMGFDDDPEALEQVRSKMIEDTTATKKAYGEMMRGGDSLIKLNRGSRNAKFIVYAPICTGWSASMLCSYDHIIETPTKIYSAMFVIGLVGLLVMFLMCYYIVRRLTRPITELAGAAREMSHGDLSVPLPVVKSRDEMLLLRDSFAYMQQSLTEYIEELKTTTAANNRMEGELNVARDIQMGMLRRDFPPYLHAILEPAKEVGGDLYDFIEHEDGVLYFAIGDVSGKGAPAALMMSITRAALRFVAGLGLSIEQVVSRVNNSIVDSNSGEMFVTLFVGRLDLKTGRLEYCNGGHNPIIVVRPDSRAHYVKAKPNLALGVMENFPYQGESVQLEPGSRLLLYTDGVTEAERDDKSQYGEGRLLAWASGRGPHGTEQEEAEALYQSVKDFAAGNPQNDDITIMSIKING